MFDGSTVPLEENLVIAEELLELSQKARTLLEIEIGVVGGEEDGHEAEINEKLYTTPEDGLATVRALGTGERGRYLTALTFGNVHGVYKPGAVKLRPELLGEIQQVVGQEVGKDMPFDLVFHGGSGSTAEEIALAVDNGVIKMNIDTDTQYAFTRPVVDHMFKQLRRRAQDRRRGRQQEGLRPARLGQARRGRDGRPRSSRPASSCARPAPRWPDPSRRGPAPLASGHAAVRGAGRQPAGEARRQAASSPVGGSSSGKPGSTSTTSTTSPIRVTSSRNRTTSGGSIIVSRPGVRCASRASMLTPEESMKVTCRASISTGSPARSASATASVSSADSATSTSPESTSRVREGETMTCTEPVSAAPAASGPGRPAGSSCVTSCTSLPFA